MAVSPEAAKSAIRNHTAVASARSGDERLLMTPAKRKITVLPGDGIGPEVVEAAIRIIEATKVPVEFERHEAGAAAFKKGIETGIPPETIASIESTRVVLKGPLETPIG